MNRMELADALDSMAGSSMWSMEDACSLMERAAAALRAGVPDNLRLMREAFVTSVSCGPDEMYKLVFKFRNLADLQQAHRDWLAASPQPPEVE